MSDAPGAINPFVALSPDAVRQAATVIARPHDPKSHWTQFAALLGAIDDRRLYEAWSFRSTRAWAEHDLDLSPSESNELLRLYRILQTAGRPLTDWATISKGKARVIARALHLGGDPAMWLDHALSSATEDALQAILLRQVGKDVFVPFTVHIPESLVPLVQEALRRALPEAVEEELPEDPAEQDRLVEKREYAFRCLEVVVRAFLQ